MPFHVVCQMLLLVYHQLTTWCDFHPFNGARNYSRRDRWMEAGNHLVLMAIPPIGFFAGLSWTATFAIYYYWVLFAAEIVIWWIPYLALPRGHARGIYNFLLELATGHFAKSGEDALARWKSIHARIHGGTVTILPSRRDRPVPNLEHMLLHALTLLTAIATTLARR